MPNCGQEVQIVKDLAPAESQNHRHLLEEYEVVRQIRSSVDSAKMRGLAPHQNKLSKRLVDERDRCTGETVDKTHRVGEIGLIFLGMLQPPDGLLSRGIQVTRLGEELRAPSGTSTLDATKSRRASR